MSTTDPNQTGRPGGRPAGGGMPRPATPMVAVIIAVVAGLLGLLILKNVKDDGSSSGGSSKPAKTTTAPTTDPSQTTEPPTTQPVLIRTGATVLVANASGQDGMAGQLTTELTTRGYVTAKAVTSTVKQDVTTILAKPGDAAATAVAKTLLLEMGLSGTVQPLTDAAPLKEGELGTATVVLLLGKDKAGQPLPALGSSTTQTTAAAPTQTTGGSSDTTKG